MIIIDMFLKKMCWKHKLRCYSTISYNNDDYDFIRVDDEVDGVNNDDDDDDNDDDDDDDDDDCLDIIIVYMILQLSTIIYNICRLCTNNCCF